MMQLGIFKKTVSAIVYSLVNDKSVNKNDAARFVLRQFNRMPDYYKIPLYMLTIVFGVSTIIYKGAFYYSLNNNIRVDILNRLKISKSGILKDYIRFYSSLVAMA